ncbi:unnamed protein product [Closterium sp. NIES-65]|nr:unnamed protein product [Closterium sp. NIES-65]
MAASSPLKPEAECVFACTECSLGVIIPRTSLPKSTLPGSAHQVSCPLCRSTCHEIPSVGSGGSSSSNATSEWESKGGVIEAGPLHEDAAAVKSGLVMAEGEKDSADSAKVQADGFAEKDDENDGAGGAGQGERGKRSQDSSEAKAETGDMVGEGEVGKGKGKAEETEGAGKEDVVASESDGSDDEDDGSTEAGCGGSSTGMPTATPIEGAASGMESAAGSDAIVTAVGPGTAPFLPPAAGYIPGSTLCV